jgi:hypothetical protein
LRRAGTFSSGETASSRSRNTWTAASTAAYASILGDEPGTARQERRNRTYRTPHFDRAVSLPAGLAPMRRMRRGDGDPPV